MKIEYHPTPTEVIAAWIPHDARWHEAARRASDTGVEAVRKYVSGLLLDHRAGDRPLTDDFDLRSIAAVRDDLGAEGIDHVDWRHVRTALQAPSRALGR
jgi:hypothetical protein